MIRRVCCVAATDAIEIGTGGPASYWDLSEGLSLCLGKQEAGWPELAEPRLSKRAREGCDGKQQRPEPQGRCQIRLFAAKLTEIENDTARHGPGHRTAPRQHHK